MDSGTAVTPRSVRGLFTDWNIGSQLASKMDDNRLLRISSFREFEDHYIHKDDENIEPFVPTRTLTGLTRRERKIVWRELKREQRKRAQKYVTRSADND